MSTEFTQDTTAFLAPFLDTKTGNLSTRSRARHKALDGLSKPLSSGWRPVVAQARSLAMADAPKTRSRVAGRPRGGAAVVSRCNAILNGSDAIARKNAPHLDHMTYRCSGAGKAGRADSCEGVNLGSEFGARTMERKVRVSDVASLERYRATCDVTSERDMGDGRVLVRFKTVQNACKACRSLSAKHGRTSKVANGAA